MTTIAYRDGVMASDSGCWTGNACHPWTRKLAKGVSGTLYGVSGGAGECEAFLRWVDAGEDEASMPKPVPVGASEDARGSFNVLRVKAGAIEIITAFGVEAFPGAPYMATGAGASTAFGAFFMGATAEQAIAAAVEHGDGAIAPVKSIRAGRPA